MTRLGAAAATVVLALVLRLYHLDGRSLWIDEVISSEAATLRHLSDVFAYTRSYGNESPLPDVITWAFRVFGASDFVLRLPSAIEGTLCVLVIYLLGSVLFRPRVGLIAASVTAVLPFAVWYSQEARPYSLLMLLTTTQMLFAYLAVTRRRVWYWAGLVTCSVLNLYTHYAALPLTAAAFLFVAAAVVIQFFQDSYEHRRQNRPPQPFGLFLGAALLTAAMYLPWLVPLRMFIANPALGFGRLPYHYVPSLADASRLLLSLGFDGLLLIAVGFGFIALFQSAVAGRAFPLLLLSVWLVVPLAGFYVKLGGGIVLIPPRYLAGLVPAAIVLAALGGSHFIEVLPNLIHDPSRRLAVRIAVGTLVALGLIAATVPALTASYAQPKDDYRSAAGYVEARGALDSTVVGLGEYSAFIAKGMGYYFALHHSRIRAFDGSALTQDAAEWLKASSGPVWGAVYTNYAHNDLERADLQSVELKRFPGLSLIRARGLAASPTGEAMWLLKWATQLRPVFGTSLTLLRFDSGLGSYSENSVPRFGETISGERWAMDSSSSVETRGQVVELSSQGPMVNVIFNTSRFDPLSTYLLLFQSRNPGLVGDQRVFASIEDSTGKWLAIFPDGYGYRCQKSTAWTRGAFAFRIPPGAQKMTIWLRVTGHGTAEFGDVELREARN